MAMLKKIQAQYNKFGTEFKAWTDTTALAGYISNLERKRWRVGEEVYRVTDSYERAGALEGNPALMGKFPDATQFLPQRLNYQSAVKVYEAKLKKEKEAKKETSKLALTAQLG